MTLNGSTIRADRDANKRFYGTGFKTDEIVFEGLSGTPEPVATWRDTLVKHAR